MTDINMENLQKFSDSYRQGRARHAVGEEIDGRHGGAHRKVRIDPLGGGPDAEARVVLSVFDNSYDTITRLFMPARELLTALLEGADVVQEIPGQEKAAAEWAEFKAMAAAETAEERRARYDAENPNPAAAEVLTVEENP